MNGQKLKVIHSMLRVRMNLVSNQILKQIFKEKNILYLFYQANQIEN